MQNANEKNLKELEEIKKDYPLISILIPTYNTKSFIKKTISCVLTQSYPNLEIIIVDDGSTDGTKEYLQKTLETYYGPKQLIIALSDHKGVGGTRNELLMRAHGEYIFWLDSDDIITPDTILNCYKLLSEEGCDAVRIDFTQNYAGIVFMDTQAYMRLLLMDSLKSYLTATLFKKSLWNGLAFDKSCLIEDYDIYPSVALRIKKLGLIRNSVLYSYERGRNGSLTTSHSTALSGLVPRMTLAEERYKLFRGMYPVECETILSQFANYACMVYFKSFMNKDMKLYAEESQNLIRQDYDSLMATNKIPQWRKREIQAIARNKKFKCFLFKEMHNIKQHHKKRKW